MNKTFSIVEDSSGNKVVASENAKRKGKKGAVAAILFSALLGGSAFAAVSTVGSDNIVTTEKGVATGYNNAVTAVKGTATGNDSVSTGGNISREEFSAKLDNHKEIVNGIKAKEDEIKNANNDLELNKQKQDDLAKQIADLERKNQNAQDKTNKLNGLQDQKDAKANELTKLEEALNEAKANAQTQKADGSTQDKLIYTDFTKQLNRLNWNELTNDSNGTTGVNKVATQLKGMIESDLPDLTKFDIRDYETVITGYINRQGLFDANTDNTGEKYKNEGVVLDSPIFNNYIEQYNKRAGGSGRSEGAGRNQEMLFHTWGGNYDYIPNVLEKIIQVDDLTNGISSLNDLTYSHVFQYERPYSVTNQYGTYLQTESYDDAGKLKIAELLETSRKMSLSNPLLVEKNKQYIAETRYNVRNMDNEVDWVGKSFTYNNLIALPPIKAGEKATTRAISGFNIRFFVENTFRNELANVNNGVVSDGNVKAYINKEDVAKIKEYITYFDGFYDHIDFDADQSKWTINKSKFVNEVAGVKSFRDLLDNYVKNYEKAVANPNDIDAQKNLVVYYNQIRETKSNNGNYYNTAITPEYTQEMSELFNQTAKQVQAEFQSDADKLKLYDARQAVIKGVLDTVNNLKNEVDKAQKAVDDKQKEIDGINKEIGKIDLTDDERNANDLKRQKEDELRQKEAEKDKLTNDLNEKKNELDGLNNQLANTNLKDFGLRAIAIGQNAFASGNDSIALGTNTTVQNQDAIAIGTNSKVTGAQSIAIGSNNNVTGNKSIAIGVGHTVSGNRAGTFGDPNVVRADDAYAIGNAITINESANNTFVLGNNVTADVANSVVLGNSSTVETPVGTSSIELKGTTYNFAGTAPVGTVSVGSENGERTITHVAAGRVSEASTDAINGSQLYALAKAVEENAVSPDVISDAIGKAGWNVTTTATDGTVKGSSTQLINSTTPLVIDAGKGITISQTDNTISIAADVTQSTTLSEGDNVKLTSETDPNTGVVTYKVSANGTTVSGGTGITVTPTTTTGANGATITNYEVALTDDLKASIAKEESVTAGSTNLVVKQEGTNETGGKNFVVDLAKNVNLGNDGSLTIGNITLSPNNVNMGGNTIHNIGAPQADTDAANKKYVDDGRTTVNSTDGSVIVNETVNANGGKNFDLKANQTFTVGNGNGDGIKVGNNGRFDIVGGSDHIVTKVDGNNVSVDLGDKTKTTIGKIEKGLNTATDDGKVVNYQLGDTIAITGDNKNLSTTTTADGKVRVQMSDDLKVNSVTTNNVKMDGNGVTIKNGPSMTTNGINAGDKKITNVAAGEISPTSTDAVNGSQLYATNNAVINLAQNQVKLGDQINHVNNKVDNLSGRVDGLDRKIDKVDRRAKAGTAAALAAAGLPQAHREGQSGLVAAVGQYQSQTAIAAGYSRISDNGKWTVKAAVTANTRGGVGGNVGVGYFW